MIIPVVTETFKECLVPYCGISIHISQLSTITLLNTFHLVSHDNCILFILVQQQIIQHRATFGLLNRTDSISLLLQFINSLHRIFKILPIDSFFRSQSRLMNLGMRRTSRDTAQVNTLHPKSIRQYETRILSLFKLLT